VTKQEEEDDEDIIPLDTHATPLITEKIRYKPLHRIFIPTHLGWKPHIPKPHHTDRGGRVFSFQEFHRSLSLSQSSLTMHMMGFLRQVPFIQDVFAALKCGAGVCTYFFPLLSLSKGL